MTNVNTLFSNNKDKPKEKARSLLLDTLEVTAETFKSKSHETLYSYALSKYKTNEKVKLLFDVSQDKKYWKAWHCNNIFLRDGQTIKGSLCRTRQCNHCNRIKQAELVNGYQTPLQDLAKQDKLYFVTLTAPTVKERQLKAEISKRYKAWKRAKDKLRKQGYSINGVRKLETNYNIKKDWYHPHFHIVIQGKTEAELLLKYWLNEFPKANLEAQDIREIGTTAKDLLEVFKYATKEIVTDKATAHATHKIYEALKGRRVFQTYGKIRKVKEPKEQQTETKKYEWLNPNTKDIYAFEQSIADWTTAYNKPLVNTNEIARQLIHNNYENSTNNKRSERLSKNTIRYAKDCGLWLQDDESRIRHDKQILQREWNNKS
jgi:hypothetical protein